jgi:hypothetical protein
MHDEPHIHGGTIVVWRQRTMWAILPHVRRSEEDRW